MALKKWKLGGQDGAHEPKWSTRSPNVPLPKSCALPRAQSSAAFSAKSPRQRTSIAPQGQSVRDHKGPR